MSAPAPQPAAADLAPGDILLHLIVTLLAPMFLGVCGGHLDFARMAALETVNAYRARSHVDLIAVAQIVAHGLASVSAACRSMADDTSLAMTLRLRASANASDRACDRARRALEKNRASPAPEPVFGAAPGGEASPRPTPDPEADRKDAEVFAQLAAVRQQGEALLADHPARRAAAQAAVPTGPAAAVPTAHGTTPAIQTATIPAPAAAIPPAAIQPAEIPAATPPRATARPTTPTPDPDTELGAQQFHQLWGAAMTVVADEYAANMAHLPPAERDAARARAAVLAKAAGDLYAGNLPPRPRPGDLGAPSAF